MSTLVRVKVLFFIISILFLSSKVFSDTSILPIQVGNWWEYQQHDSAFNSWTTKLEIVGTQTIGGNEYFKIGTWSWDYPSDPYSEFLGRTSGNVFFMFKGGEDKLFLQIAPVGTTWSYRDTTSGGETGWRVNEIISIESVSVPSGTFDSAYVQRDYFDFDDPYEPNSPYGYSYMVDGVGLVKRVNEWAFPQYTTPPNVQELVNFGTYPFMGDMNKDGIIDISDVILVLRMALKIDPVQPCSDINNDGIVDIADVILTLRMALKIDPLKQCTEWQVKNLEGEWFLVGEDIQGNHTWDGLITIDSTGAVTGGTITSSAGPVYSTTSGNLTIDSTGKITGSFTDSDSVTTQFTMQMNNTKDIMAGEGNATGNEDGIFVFIKRK